MAKRGNVTLNITDTVDHFQIVTTDIVCSEIQTGLNKMKSSKIYNNVSVNNDEIEDISKIWMDIKSSLIIKKGISDPIRLKDRGEQSLVYLCRTIDNNVKIVSNNRKDVIKFLEIINLNISIYETPFEFYEEVHRSWFKDYKDLIKFMILANNNFRVYDKNFLGKNILKRL